MSQDFILESETIEKDGCLASFINISCQATYSHCLIVMSTEGVHETEVKEHGSLLYASALKIMRLKNEGWQTVEHKAYGRFGNYNQACGHLIKKIMDYNPTMSFKHQMNRALKRTGLSLDLMRSAASYSLEFGDWA